MSPFIIFKIIESREEFQNLPFIQGNNTSESLIKLSIMGYFARSLAAGPK